MNTQVSITTMRGFPWDFNRDDPLSVRDHSEKLESLREAALKNPLRHGTVFKETLNHQSAERDRPLISFSRGSDPCTLVLRTPLRTTINAWSQVWIASVHDTSAGPSELGDGPNAERVVLKFIQPSMLPIPSTEWTSYLHYRPPRGLALFEATVYRQLHAVQGSAVPYFYGLREVSLTCVRTTHLAD